MILPGSLILIIWGELSVEIDCKCNSVHIALCPPDPFSHDENSLVIIEFLPHLFPHERVRSGDHWVLTTPFSSGDHWVLTTPISSWSREGEVWWSSCSYHTYFLTRGWGLYMKLVFMFTMWNDLCTPYLPLEYGIWSSPPWGYSQGNCHWPR